MGREIIVKTVGLTKTYGNQRALDQVDIVIPRGSIYGLVGNNGAGKTTFLKILAGHIFQTEGTFQILGENMESGQRKVRKRCGAIIENPGFYPGMTAARNLEYYRIQRGIPGKNTVRDCLKLTGLAEAAGKKYSRLSLGMKQRLGLALALMGEPEFLILDEPINGLDPSGIVEIRNLLRRLNEEKNVTILISSHILAELEEIATDYGFLNRGRLAEQTTAEKLREKCRIYMEVSVTDAQKYAALLEARLHCTNYKVMPDNRIHIMENPDQAMLYSALAVENGIGLLSLERKEIRLEDYYMHLIGGGNTEFHEGRKEVCNA